MTTSGIASGVLATTDWPRGLRTLLALGLILGTILSPAARPLSAVAASQDAIQVQASAAGVEVVWTLPDDPAWQAGFSFQPAGDHQIPVHTFTVTPRDGAGIDPAGVQIQHLETRPYSGELPDAPAMTPNALDYTRPAHVEPVATPPLPTAPLFILREATVRGRAETIVALSPIFQHPDTGALVVATTLRALIPGAHLPETTLDIAQIAGPLGPQAAVPPNNPHAAQAAWRIQVAQGGIQELRAADLAAAGLSAPPANTLRLYHNGQEVALHVLDTNGNERIDAADDGIRFYAPPPGDRWNQRDVYWLVQGSTSGQRMAVQPAQNSDAPIRTTAYAEGLWRQPRFYNSTIAGPSGDSWFHLDAVGQSNVAAQDRRFQAQIAPDLPLTSAEGLTPTVEVDAVLYRLPGNPFSNVAHTLRFASDNGAHIDHTYSFSDGGSTLPVTYAAELAAPTASLEVTLLIGAQPIAALFDRVHWRQPVDLDFRIDGQNRGAAFSPVEGAWRYRLRNLPAGAALYAITNPRAPEIVTLNEAGSDRLFAADTANGAAGTYIVAGTGTLHTPQIQRHTPTAAAVSALAQDGADALYIAPAEFHDALAPLVEHRQGQGYAVTVIDVQSIYDGWSYGQVSSDAIRDFLRHAVATWQPAPISVVLVGDGTHDPHSYLGHNNPNIIPPYLADVDPWLRETTCDSCYGQLSGDDPLGEDAFTMDIWVGRFPVINTSELLGVVHKILRYETAGDTDAPWRRIAVQITDDYFQPDGTTDRAGDFVASAEYVNALKPDLLHIKRNYFNVELSEAHLAHLDTDKRALYESYLPWFTYDPDEAWLQSIGFMNQGAGLITYTGHANHWKWATTTEDSLHNQLFGLWDVLRLNNRDALFIGLSMTCYTSQFSEPAPSHITLDEHLFLRANGGAIAVWGPAGLSVVHGHDRLQEGFHRKLWEAEPMTARMGELIQAGYAEIRRQACCQDVLKTFLLLGDPLTPARVQAFDINFVPTLERAE